MPESVKIIGTALLMPPVVVALTTSWISARMPNDGETRRVLSFRAGVWITVICASLYFGFLALLAAINAKTSGPVYYVVLPIVITVISAAVSVGLYILSNRMFRRIRNNSK